MHHNYWVCALSFGNCSYWAHVLQLLKSVHPGAHAPQQEKPLQREARAQQGRVAQLSATREKPMQQQGSNTAKDKRMKQILSAKMGGTPRHRRMCMRLVLTFV